MEKIPSDSVILLPGKYTDSEIEFVNKKLKEHNIPNKTHRATESEQTIGQLFAIINTEKPSPTVIISKITGKDEKTSKIALRHLLEMD